MKKIWSKVDPKTGRFLKGPLPQPPRNEQATHVRILDQVFLYDSKAPFVKSGVSIRGAVEIDPLTDQVRCHECGRYYQTLTGHTQTHGLTAREYKLKHGLNLSAALIGERSREARIKSGILLYKRNLKFKEGWAAAVIRSAQFRKGQGLGSKNQSNAENMNARGVCAAQCLEKLKSLAGQLNRSPTFRELREVGILYRTLAFHFGSVKAAYKLAGLKQNKQCRNITDYPQPGVFTDGQLIGFIVNFIITHNRRPWPSDSRRGILPSRCIYIRRFGGFKRALALARRKIKQDGRKLVHIGPTVFVVRPITEEKRHKIKMAKNKCPNCHEFGAVRVSTWRKSCPNCGHVWRTNAAWLEKKRNGHAEVRKEKP